MSSEALIKYRMVEVIIESQHHPLERMMSLKLLREYNFYVLVEQEGARGLNPLVYYYDHL